MTPRRFDLDLYNVLLGFGWARERGELIKATIDPRFLLRARRASVPPSDRGPYEGRGRKRGVPTVPATSRDRV